MMEKPFVVIMGIMGKLIVTTLTTLMLALFGAAIAKGTKWVKDSWFSKRDKGGE